jgi:hypothetical protein
VIHAASRAFERAARRHAQSVREPPALAATHSPTGRPRYIRTCVSADAGLGSRPTSGTTLAASATRGGTGVGSRPHTPWRDHGRKRRHERARTGERPEPSEKAIAHHRDVRHSVAQLRIEVGACRACAGSAIRRLSTLACPPSSRRARRASFRRPRGSNEVPPLLFDSAPAIHPYLAFARREGRIALSL